MKALAASAVSKFARSAFVMFALAGCQPPGPAPLTALPPRACAAMPETASAPVLSDGKSEAIDVTADSPCLATPAGPALYTAFRLPSRRPAMVEIVSVLRGEALFSPRALLLNAAGHVNRAIGSDDFLFRDDVPFRASGLSALVRLRPEDAVLVVTSDPETVGRQLSRIVTRVTTTVISTGVVTITQPTGTDRRQELVQAHNGRLVVTFRLLAENP